MQSVFWIMKSSTDHDHRVTKRRDVIEQDSVQYGTAHTDTLQSLGRQLRTAGEVKVHKTTTPLPSLDVAKTSRSEMKTPCQTQVVEVATATGMEWNVGRWLEWNGDGGRRYRASVLMVVSVTQQYDRLRQRRPEHPLVTMSITSSYIRIYQRESMCLQ